jgi:hypothetical protein
MDRAPLLLSGVCAVKAMEDLFCINEWKNWTCRKGFALLEILRQTGMKNL